MSTTVDVSERTVRHGSSEFDLTTPEAGAALEEDTLVLLWGFAAADKKTISKYRDIYHRRGLSVLYIPSPFKNCLWPNRLYQLSTDLTAYLTSCSRVQMIIVHAMSYGIVSFTLFLDNTSSEVTQRISTVVFDSPGHINSATNMSRAISLVVSDYKVVQWLVYLMCVPYFTLLHRHTVRIFKWCTRRAEVQPLPRPTLMLLCKNDPLGNGNYFQDTVQTWAMPVVCKCWDRSGHCSHLYFHREEYLQILGDFLARYSGMNTVGGPKCKL